MEQVSVKRKRAPAKKKEEEEEEKEEEEEEEEEQKEEEEAEEKGHEEKGKGKEKKGEEEEEEKPAPSKKARVASNSRLLAHLNEGKWKELLAPEFEKPYFKKIEEFLDQERKSHGADKIYPPEEDVFNALNTTPFEQVKVVVIGQDPYFKKGQAHGLSFSVRKGVAVPPSLNRIYNELLEDPDIKGFRKPKHGCLQEWAAQGVLLLNASLTVRDSKPNSHEKCGWQTFTDAIIKCLNDHNSGIVYLLWGGFAQKKGKGISTSKNHVLQCPHPSPMSGSAWNGNRHFSKANNLLTSMGKSAIDWQITG